MPKVNGKTLSNTLLKVPRLNKPPSYRAFLNEVLRVSENKKFLTIHGKAAIDAEYKRLLEKDFSNNEVVELLRETQARENLGLWDRFKSRALPSPPIVAAASNAAHLTLPVVGYDPKDDITRDSGWARQTYANFAAKLRKKNPSVKFDKALMDDAFTLAANRSQRGGRIDRNKIDLHIARVKHMIPETCPGTCH
ncbi:hypothetical protein Slin15195_G057970 [Septoria linicola]|uniref:Uncharacterized protein n=1 Tax=Septoria linicola TaxID=215465 RepID=A0A9Q9ASN8_9PEZI|nr:hypothetical protein Slin14017_G073820 [Septoria linicola]USW52478.1 hypothetical protein Slin15195_G057970 [Septoria linicola]